MDKELFKRLAAGADDYKKQIDENYSFLSASESEKEQYELISWEHYKLLDKDSIVHSFSKSCFDWNLMLQLFEATEEYEYCQKVMEIKEFETKEFCSIMEKKYGLNANELEQLLKGLIAHNPEE